MKGIIIAFTLIAGIAVQAEWYLVSKVLDYNHVELILSKGSASKSGTKVRIRNLEKIEYIENDRSKVLLNGTEPKNILKEILLGQVVWVDEIETVNGEQVASIYPSYEQVLKVFTYHRMSGQYTLSPEVKQKLENIYHRMLAELRNESPNRSSGKGNKENDSKAAYENSYSKALFVYDSLDWFKKTGQYLPIPVQELYIDWLSSYFSSNGGDAYDLEIKILDMRKRHGLYRDFLDG